LRSFFKTIVGDTRQHLAQAAGIALSRTDIVIFMGGLGPTEDDLTREAVAEALKLELQRDPDALQTLEQRFASRKMKITPNNYKQADVIPGAIILPNPNGSAPGLVDDTIVRRQRQNCGLVARSSSRTDGHVR